MISEEEVYNALTFRWQTGRNVRKKVAEAKDMHWSMLGIGTVYMYLGRLVDHGFADMQSRNPNPDEEVRRGCKIFEYRKSGTNTPNYSNLNDEFVPVLA